VLRVEGELRRHLADPKILNNAGCVITSSGDPTRGTELLAQAHEKSPNDPTIGYNYARGLYAQGKLDEAIAQIASVIQQKPEFDEARLLRASVAVAKNDYPTAEREIQQLVKRIQLAAFLIEGVIQLAKGNVQAALAAFQQALKLAPNSDLALYNSGVAYQQKNDPTHAADYYKRAIRVNPSLAEAHNNLGSVLAQNGDLKGALDEVFEAASLKPNDDKLVNQLSVLKRTAGAPADELLGDWVTEDGTLDILGTLGGQRFYGVRVPGYPTNPCLFLTFTKSGEGTFDLIQGAKFRYTGLDRAARFQIQTDGSYLSPTTLLPGSETSSGPPWLGLNPHAHGIVTIWANGDKLLGKSAETASGPNASLQVTWTWKARRAHNGETSTICRPVPRALINVAIAPSPAPASKPSSPW